MQIKSIKLWSSYLQRFKVKLSLWHIAVLALLSMPAHAMAAPSDAEALQGHWRLEQAGAIESDQLKAYDFNSCRLLRTYSLRADGYAIYSSAEGEEGACVPLEPRLSHWRIEGKRLVFYIGDEVLEEAEVVWLDAQRLRLDFVVDLAQSQDGQTPSVWPLKFTTYQILRRANQV